MPTGIGALSLFAHPTHHRKNPLPPSGTSGIPLLPEKSYLALLGLTPRAWAS